MEIIDYKILMHNDPFNLELLVKAVISEGWQPFGGVAVKYSPSVNSWWQVMVKYAPDIKPKQ